MNDDVHTRVVAYLAAHSTLTLATEEDGVPNACSLFYVNDGLILYFVSESKTRHALNIGENPRVGVTVHEDYDDWRAIQGIQMLGKCELVNEQLESARALVLFTKKFSFVAALGAAMAKIKFYRITPSWVRMIDNTRGFGFKEEIQV